MSKYRNKRAQSLDGHCFDSMAERDRYEELRLLARAGEISNLELQPKFEIVPRYRYNGSVVTARVYKADFAYNERGNPRRVVEDVKGAKTATFSLKWALVRYQYPDIDWRIVNA